MGRKPEKEVVKICSEDLRKLFFIKEFYKVAEATQTAEKVVMGKVTDYAWLGEWNEKDSKGLKPGTKTF